MSEIYVFIGTEQQYEQERTLTNAPPGALEFIFTQSAFEGSYQDLFLEATVMADKHKETYSQVQSRVLDTLKGFVANNDSTVWKEALTYNRKTRSPAQHSIEHIVQDTAGPSVYQSKQKVGDEFKDFPTLEVYLIQRASGGSF